METTLTKSLLLLSLFGRVLGSVTEVERVEQYHLRNYSWPPATFIPDTPGWKSLMEHRLRQVAEIENATDRYQGYAFTLSAAMIQPNFTQHGFGLVRAPENLMEALRAGIQEGVANGLRLESEGTVISGERPWFIDRLDLTERVGNDRAWISCFQCHERFSQKSVFFA
jgi:hypothetical protein